MTKISLRTPRPFSSATRMVVTRMVVTGLAVTVPLGATASIVPSAYAAPIAATERDFTFSSSAPIYQVKPQSTLDLTDEVTLEAWVQADKMNREGGRILDKSVPNTLDGYSLDTFPGNSLRFSTQGGVVSYDAQLPADQWTHVVGVYSASKRILKLYINGQEVVSKTNGNFPPMTVTEVPLRLGADPQGNNRFSGRILRATVYGIALTQTEVTERYTMQTKTPGILGEWNLTAQPGAVIAPATGTLALERAAETNTIVSPVNAQKVAKPDPLVSPISANTEPMQTGKFEPTWESLKQYQTPEWFRDAKFGIWAHWGPQCEPEAGDWYARYMYLEGRPQYNVHLKKYGHPSQFGFKEVIREFKAENWNPEHLMALYKRAGAQYFFAMANHHDNFDMWDSKYQPWNSVNMGPKRDVMAGWAKAARNQGLRFGVSVHAAHAWTWYEPSQGADKNGPHAGVPYDGNLTKADGVGKWWEGYDPQDLYAQKHPRSANASNISAIHSQWNWGNGASIPDVAYCDRFYNRTVDLINRYQPDLIYFDDTALPLWPISDAGLKIAAHLYNSNMKRNKGQLEAVLFGKILDQEQRKAMVWDIERGQSNVIEPLPWQTDTCIGGWHYDQAAYDRNQYKSAKTVIQMLADIVSKNGNLLLNVPVRGDGTIDEKEVTVVEGIAAWMGTNSESIFGTRPWKVFGEGPASESAAPLSAQGFNEGKGKPFTAQDVRFTTKGNALYAIVLGQPKESLTIKSLGKTAGLLDKQISSIRVLGTDEKVAWKQEATGLIVEPVQTQLWDSAVVFKITLK